MYQANLSKIYKKMLMCKEEHSSKVYFNIILIILILIPMIFITTTKAEKYVPYDYKFTPMPKYEELRKPGAGRNTYTKDPHVWVYTSEFAKRFGMPEKWIDDSLEGAQAIAYRAETSNVEKCGWFGEIDNCGKSPDCVLEIYIKDEDSAKLPWSSEISVEWNKWDRSTIFLRMQYEDDLWYWTDEVNNRRYIRNMYDFSGITFVGGPPKLLRNKSVGGRKKKVYTTYASLRIKDYRRSFFKGLDFFKANNCLFFSMRKPVRLYFQNPYPDIYNPKYRLPDGEINFNKIKTAEQIFYDNEYTGNPLHKVRIPDAYYDRAKEYNKKVRHLRSLGVKVLKRFTDKEINMCKEVCSKIE